MHIKMGDFGLACKLEYEGQKRKTICGTPNYIAPEILRKKGHCYEVDLWSLGVIIYAMLVGRPPFETSEVKKTYERIKRNAYSYPDYVPLSEHAKSIIGRLLVLDPSKRLSLDEILQHPFMGNWQNIPDHLPLSIHACPPSLTFMRQFMNKTVQLRSSQAKKLDGTDRQKFMSTDNFSKNQTLGKFKNFQGGNTQVSNIDKVAMKSYASSTRKLRTQNQFPKVNNQNNNFYATVQDRTETQEIYVKKWVDYSSKYGLGYLLSNGSAGVFFNDSTKIILSNDGGYFEYMERKPQEKIDIVSTHTFEKYPNSLEKKVTLLKHFRSYLDADKAPQGKSLSPEELKEKKTQILTYVKKWMKTKHAIMFRLSNKIVQVDFTDKTEIILSTKSKMVTYVNKKGQKSYYAFAKAFESKNGEMARRLKYTKEILTYINKKNTKRKVAY